MKTICSITLLFACLNLPFSVSGEDDLFAEFMDAVDELQQAPGEMDAAVDAVVPALVRIHVVSGVPKDGRMVKRVGSGSGTIISKDGYVLTNHHVAGKAQRISCRLANRMEVKAELVGTDILTDLAVLKLDLSDWDEAEFGPIPVASFGDSDRVGVGDVVLAMGSPAGLSQSVTRGIVANMEMIPPSGGKFNLDGENVGMLVRWIGHDAVIFPGNSGGPLVDLEGNIIGVNEVGIGSLGGAIPGNLAQEVAQELIAHGEVRRSWTGLVTQPLPRHLHGSVQGVLVSGVLPESPAEKSGLEPGDIVVEFGGKSVHAATPEEMPPFNRLVMSTPVGKDVGLVVLRSGKKKAFRLTTDARESRYGDDVEFRGWGMTVRALTKVSELELRNGRGEEREGVVVHSVRKGGAAFQAKPSLVRNDLVVALNGKPVTQVSDLRKVTQEIVGDAESPVPVLVTFLRGESELLTVAHVGPPEEDDDPERARKPWLGAGTQVLTDDLAEALELKGKKGVRITRLIPGAPAEKAGLQVGDILWKLDGRVIPVRREEDAEVLNNLVRQYRSGAKVPVVVLRGGKELEVEVTLAARPAPASDLPEFENKRFEFTVRDLSEEDRLNDPEDTPEHGVLVTRVESGGWANLAGLRRTDRLLEIDGEPVNGVGALKSTLKSLEKNQPRFVQFFVQRGIYTRYLELEPVWDDSVKQ